MSVPIGQLGVCLDLDGVLWDTEIVHRDAFDATCREAGLDPLPYRRLAGLPTEAAFRAILASNGEPAPPNRLVDELSGKKRRRARRVLAEHPPLVPDIGALRAIADVTSATALVTGASTETAALFGRAVEGLHRFSVVVTAETGGRGKPWPDPYLVAASSLGLPPSSCWVLEDSMAGLASGLASGARTVHRHSEDDDIDCQDAAACVTSLTAFADLLCQAVRS